MAHVIATPLPASGSDRRPLDCRDLAGLVWRQRWTMGVVVALCTAVAALACYGLPASYRATTLVVYEPSPVVPGDPFPANGATDGVDGEVEIVHSEAMLGAVADRVAAGDLDDWTTGLKAFLADLPAILAHAVALGDLVPDPEQQSPEERRQTVAALLGRRITVARRGMTNVMAVEVRAARPETAARIANLTAALYVEQQFGRKTGLAQAARSVLAERTKAAEQQWRAENAALLAPRAAPNAAAAAGVGRGAAGWPGPSPALRASILADRVRSAFSVLQGALAQQAAFDQRLAFLAADARIVSPATADPVPASPQRPLILAGSLMLGFCLAGAIGHRRDAARAPFASPRALEQALGAPVLASLPRLDGPTARRQGRQAVHEVVEEPHSPYSAALRRLSLMVAGQGSPCTLLVTSAAAREGKSLTALALARTLALSGRRTLLIDCDLARPALATLLDVRLHLGLADHLAGPARDLRSFARRDEGSGADMLLGLPREDLASDRLLASPDFAELLHHSRRLYDVVVLDAPALSTSVDPLVLARHADRCLVVIDQRRAEQAAIEDALAALNRTQAIPVGLVLNGLEAARPQRPA